MASTTLDVREEMVAYRHHDPCVAHRDMRVARVRVWRRWRYRHHLVDLLSREYRHRVRRQHHVVFSWRAW